MNKYWFVRVNNRWLKPFTYYPAYKFIDSKDSVWIYEIDLDELPKKTLVWKRWSTD